MNTENIISSRDEVVFDNRNKSYGAYLIRKSYHSNLSKGSAAGLLFVGIVFAALQAAIMFKPDLIPVIKDPFEIPISPPPTIIRDAPPPTEMHSQPKTNANLTPKPVTTPVEDPPVVENPSVASQTTGEPGGDEIPSTGTGVQSIVEPPVVLEPPKTVDIAEEMPQFEGGQRALYRFLRNHLRYPSADRMTGQEGTVFVRFVIDVSGAVTGIEIVRSVNGSLDKEAARVIGIMPNWKPGKQHGAPVNVRMVLPIKFEINND